MNWDFPHQKGIHQPKVFFGALVKISFTYGENESMALNYVEFFVRNYEGIKMLEMEILSFDVTDFNQN